MAQPTRAMGDGDPLADAGRLERFAFDQDALDVGPPDARPARQHGGETRESARLVEVGSVRMLNADAVRRQNLVRDAQ